MNIIVYYKERWLFWQYLKKTWLFKKIILKCLLDLIIICRRSKNKAKIQFVSYISLQQFKSSSDCLKPNPKTLPSFGLISSMLLSFFPLRKTSMKPNRWVSNSRAQLYLFPFSQNAIFDSPPSLCKAFTLFLSPLPFAPGSSLFLTHTFHSHYSFTVYCFPPILFMFIILLMLTYHSSFVIKTITSLWLCF